MDEELAEHLEGLDNDGADKAAPTLAVSEATPEVMLLLQLVALGRAQLQLRQKKKIAFPPLPSVRTARAAVRERRRRRHRGRVEQLVAEAKARWVAEQQAVAAPDATAPAAVWTDDT